MRGPGLPHDPTLAEMRGAFIHALVFHCRRCSHRAAIPIDDLTVRYGSRLRESEIKARAYCTQCSARIFDIMPMASWHKRHLDRR